MVEKQRDEARARADELERELPSVRSRAAAAEVAEGRIAELESRIAEQAEQAEAAAAALALAQEQVEAAETQLEEREAAASSIHSDLAKAREQADEALARAPELERELPTMRERAADAEAAEGRIAELESRVARAGGAARPSRPSSRRTGAERGGRSDARAA